jgi:hypothetical protein
VAATTSSTPAADPNAGSSLVRTAVSLPASESTGSAREPSAVFFGGARDEPGADSDDDPLIPAACSVGWWLMAGAGLF